MAAHAAEAAAAQGRFWEMHDVLFAHEDELEAEREAQGSPSRAGAAPAVPAPSGAR